MEEVEEVEEDEEEEEEREEGRAVAQGKVELSCAAGVSN